MRTIAPALAATLAVVFLTTAAGAQDSSCRGPARLETRPVGSRPASLERVRDYRPVFRHCRNAAGETLAIRHMKVDGESLLLLVDPATLTTSLEPERCWVCADTEDEVHKGTRFVRAVHESTRPARDSAAPQPALLGNAGLSHGRGDGSFMTGDLCPSRKPLDRGFLEMLAGIGPRIPVALAVSGMWIMKHGADFRWLQEQARSGALEITWVDHSYRHPYVPGRPPATNFLLTPGVDIQSEILDTERLLVANGETPSVFFRFPGLVADTSLMEIVRGYHLVVLGADGWLALGPPLRPGTILLVHPNGNEPGGLSRFSTLLESGRLPRPFRPIDEAP